MVNPGDPACTPLGAREPSVSGHSTPSAGSAPVYSIRRLRASRSVGWLSGFLTTARARAAQKHLPSNASIPILDAKFSNQGVRCCFRTPLRIPRMGQSTTPFGVPVDLTCFWFGVGIWL